MTSAQAELLDYNASTTQIERCRKPSFVNPSTPRQAHARDCLSAPLTPPRRPGRPHQETKRGNQKVKQLRLQFRAPPQGSAGTEGAHDDTKLLKERIVQGAWLRPSAGSNCPSNLLEDAAGSSFPMPGRFDN